jgi:hypothetical protein
LAIVYAEVLSFFPGWLERQLLQIPFVYDSDDAFFLKTAPLACAYSTPCCAPRPIA